MKTTAGATSFVWFVYYLCDPGDSTRSPRYVGVTRNPRLRLTHHGWYKRGQGPLRLREWIADIGAQGRFPSMIIVERVVDCCLPLGNGHISTVVRTAERATIKAYCAVGWDLLNYAHSRGRFRPPFNLPSTLDKGADICEGAELALVDTSPKVAKSGPVRISPAAELVPRDSKH